MAIKVWNGGAGTGNFGDAGNWVGGVAPVGGGVDSVLINATNIDITGVATGLAIVNFTVGSGYGGTIGSGGSPLTFTSITAVKYAGRGAACYLGATGTITSAEASHTIGTFYLTGGTWTTFTNTSGLFNIGASAVVTTFNNAAGQGTAEYHATPFTTVNNAGVFTFKRVATTFNAERGTSIQQDNGTSTYLNCTTINVRNGAFYNKQSGGTEAGITVLPGGRFSMEGNAGGSTGTVDVGTITKWAGAVTKTTAVPGVSVTVAFSYIGSPAGSTETA
jgi:hypothetical protein